MDVREIVLLETKPETEWVRGRALQKVSPTYDHARLQTLVASALTQWADAGDHGRVGTEWRFRVTPPGGATRPLVPDVAFLAYAALPAGAPRESVQTPLLAPTLAIEILSPDDRQADVEDKVATYLASGSRAVVVVDPRAETFEVHDERGMRRIAAEAGATFAHEALPEFVLDVGALFARARK